MFHELTINKFILIKSVTFQQYKLQGQSVTPSVCTAMLTVTVHVCNCSSSCLSILLMVWYCPGYSASQYWLWTRYSVNERNRAFYRLNPCFSWKREKTQAYANGWITTRAVDYGKQQCLWYLPVWWDKEESRWLLTIKWLHADIFVLSS